MDSQYFYCSTFMPISPQVHGCICKGLIVLFIAMNRMVLTAIPVTVLLDLLVLTARQISMSVTLILATMVETVQ